MEVVGERVSLCLKRKKKGKIKIDGKKKVQ